MNKQDNLIYSKIQIVYFTGTGTTGHVADTLQQQLEERGCLTEKLELFSESREQLKPCDLLILCYPVHAFNAPHSVNDWLKKHPKVHNKPAVVISVSGGGEMTPNRACRERVKILLRKRGFHTIYEAMLVMPCNILIKTPPSLSKMLLEILPEKITHIITEIMEGKKEIRRADLPNRLLSFWGRQEVAGAHLLGRTIKADRNCTGCGLCARKCPTGNIRMIKNHPAFGWKCQLCMRCFYLCPENSLKPGIGRSLVLKEGFDLKEIQTLPLQSGIQEGKKKKSHGIWAGVMEYLDR